MGNRRQAVTRGEEANKAKVGFLHLPREIRDEIYAYALAYSSGYFHPLPKWDDGIEGVCRTAAGMIRYNLFKFEPPFYVTEEIATFALMQTCRQVYLEATDMFYELNTFAIPDASSLVLQFQPLTAFLIPRIRHIWLGLDCKADPNWAVKTLHALYSWAEKHGALRTLTFNVATDNNDLKDILFSYSVPFRPKTVDIISPGLPKQLGS
jgi:hypothetical protein